MAHIKTEGTLLQLGDGATPTEVFTTVAQLFSISPNEVSAEEVETHELTSTVRTTRPNSIPDPGELGFEVYRDPAATDHNAIRGLLWSGTIRNWRVVYNNGTGSRPHDQFSAWVKSYKDGDIDADSGDLLMEGTLRLTSKPVEGTTTI